MQIHIKACIRLVSFILFYFISTTNTLAAPPFLTDDAEPADFKHLQLYPSASADVPLHNTTLSAPALELDYGIIKNVELHFIFQLTSFLPSHGQKSTGIGDTEAGIKYLFITETNSRPEIAIAPALELPTGNTDRNLGNGKLWYKLPIWIEKHWGDWLAYGGGGLGLNSAPHMKNYLFGGITLQKQIDQLLIGAEIFSQGATANTKKAPYQDTGPVTIFNVGSTYNVTAQSVFIVSAGHSIIGTPQWVAYIGWYFDI